MTDDEDFEALKAEIEGKWEAIYAEEDEAKRMRLVEELRVLIERGRARTTVDIVESVRAREGDKVAEETLKALRRASRKV
jgi:hypothetical protein